MLLRSRCQGRLLSGAAISHHPGTVYLLQLRAPIPPSCIIPLSVCTYVVVVTHTFVRCLQSVNDCRRICSMRMP